MPVNLTYRCKEDLITSQVSLKFTQYPAGERGVLLNTSSSQLRQNTNFTKGLFTIRCLFKSIQDIFDVLLVHNALLHAGAKLENIELSIPYLPAAREDRPEELRSFGLQVIVNLLNSCNFNKIYCDDLHSNVPLALFKPGILQLTHQHTLLQSLIYINKISIDGLTTCFLAPDTGALNKTTRLAGSYHLSVFSATKSRDVATGMLSNTFVPNEVKNFKNIIIADDICDGGRTFLNLAEKIKEINPTCDLHLLVTHGVFSQGRDKLASVFKTVAAYHDIDKW
jgi:ribose-phosphate pyrophosphokinase